MRAPRTAFVLSGGASLGALQAGTLRALVGGLCRKRDHLVPDDALRRLVSRHCEFEDLADAATPLHVIAYDVIAGREVLLSHGPAVDAVTASASIPGVFPPVVIGDELLIDGGVAN